MPKQRIVDKHILALLEEYKGRGIRFGDIYKTFAKRGMFHNQSDIWKNLILLLDQKKIVKVQGDTRPYYGIPLERKDGSLYLTINTGIEDEIIELGK